ncbi:hypothetical protein [Oligoflexus tunisiensis]|uniref:hypothetical protein n=1 Tax=Oligoflexus tunisiensis TaxID=708132 RepID=UPI00114CBD28|nr:hypothetical protein [Oligoflexus tunisiensis]
MKVWTTLLLTSTSLLLSHCRAANQPVSELDWAHIPLSPGYQNWLINVPPQQTIRVCGTDQEVTIAAIKKWAAVIRRDRHLNVVPCQQGNAQSATVQVTREFCDGVAFADPDTRRIMICPGIASVGFDYSHVILHEVGHLWGLCDLYAPSYYQCDRSYDEGVDPGALMMGGAGTATEIQQDDRDGLVVLSQRPEFAANRAWESFLQGDLAVPGTGSGSCTAAGTVHPEGSIIFDGTQIVECHNGNWRPILGPTSSSCEHGNTEYAEGDVIYDGQKFHSCASGQWQPLNLKLATNLCQAS